MPTGNNTAVFAQTPKSATAVVVAAVTGLGTDTPTGLVPLFTAAAARNTGTDVSAGGSILTRLTAIPRASVAASSLLLYLSTAADNYATQRLIDSETMRLQTLATGVGIDETTFANYSETRPLRLGAGDRLSVASQVGVNIVFKAEYTDF